MSRTAFFRKIGAEYANPRWSWSAVNHDKKEVYFGAWDDRTTESSAVILDEDWALNRARRSPGFSDAQRKLKHVDEEGYALLIFKMVNGRMPNEDGPSQILELDETLYPATLTKAGSQWIAVLEGQEAEISDGIHTKIEKLFPEGAKKTVTVEAIERNGAAREACIRHFGAKCNVCEMDFQKVYGDLGKGFIHVHHLNPMKLVRQEYSVDPTTDLVPLCPNCHAMVHRVNPPLSPDKLRKIIRRQELPQ
ncbi:hypothetical protein PGB28_04780 [Primorskyibacter aestuariivivens]|uniref:HNH endonuclease n=1 Tax=Primorskyibacter aestuariivivens TaxID=1888912 RepID=UPI002300D82D|nr:hypothetical protein [Primorskyibacter aestuariivivens]MDA7427764.1 hypothetical protein [Primorskyibacter aestuariivivens]